jgi:hypothetical protein
MISKNNHSTETAKDSALSERKIFKTKWNGKNKDAEQQKIKKLS